MTYWLFGDSFFDLPGYENDKVYWVDFLPDVKNLSLGGTGPHHMLPLIQQTVPFMKKHDVIVCHISDRYRITFPSELPDDQMMYITRNGLESGYSEKGIESYYEEHKEHIDFAYRAFEKIIEGFPQYTVSYLYSLDIMSIVFCSSPLPHRPKNTSTFHLSDYNLFEVSNKEFIDFDNTVHGMVDYRNCHLSDENHHVLVEYIRNFWANKPLPSFKENFIRQEDVTEKVNSNVQFIYD